MKILPKRNTAPSSFFVEKNRVINRPVTMATATISIFETRLGWMGLLGEGDELVSIFVGHSSLQTVLSAGRKAYNSVSQCDWNPLARKLMESYSEGDSVDFSPVKFRLPEMTMFRKKIVMATRRIPYGATTTYGELAQKIGHSGAARAVGTVMSTNRFPILIPCHRVLAAGGKLGGYTSPKGTDFKIKLLDIEGAAWK